MEWNTLAVGLSGTTAPIEQEYKTKEDTEGSFTSALADAYGNTVGNMDQMFEEAAWAYDISVDLLKAVAKAESNFNPSAVSHAGAIGVMQLMPGTASSLGVTNPYDARQNILGGAKYLKGNLEKFGGDVSLALAAYNAGPGSVEKYGGIPPYAETQNYVQKVLSYMDGSPLNAGNAATSTYDISALTGLGGLYGSTALNSLYGSQYMGGYYGSSGLGGLFGSYGSSMSGLFGSSALGGLGGDSSASMSGLAGLYGGTWGLAGLGGMSGSSAMTGLGSLYGMSSIYGSSAAMMSLLYGAAAQRSGSGEEEDSDRVSMDKESYYNLVELLRLQMMMNAGGSVGNMML
ncbi:MAG: lytic transglycosylase domain-containing protein [Lachnospiraceae bacterium]|jgi:hypothetical protein|nr:lytic transglycosylase domain-containing protein [Lachnospiraceae bacterium]MCI9134073.1 lytic transglycosylase domain-containing protein [Lachnospiraceae bacterium]